MPSKPTPRDQLFQTSARLFYQQGYRAIGVDTIAAESGVSKMTLYRHFPSKDDLIVAFLHDNDRSYWAYFEQATSDATAPRDKLLAYFKALQHYATSSECYGCPFINVATEYPEKEYPGHQAAIEHKQAVFTRFKQLAEAAGAHEPQSLAGALVLLMDGAYMAARMFGVAPDNPAAHVAEAAQHLIEAHCGPPVGEVPVVC